MTGEDAFELRNVRAASYGAACCLALLAYLVLSFPVARRIEFDIMASAHAVIVAEAPELVHLPEVQPHVTPDARVVRARSTRVSGNATAPRLWSYSPRGEIVFDWPEQYERCVSARARGVNQADCPDPNDRRELVLRRGARPSFDLAAILLGSRD